MMSVIEADDLSAEARSCLTRWCAGPRHELTSHEPHATLNKVRPAMDELVKKGLITSEPFNRAGSIRFRSTPEAARIGLAELKRTLLDLDKVADAPAHPGTRP